jgi:formylglycine-generating enzyme required for sulfatase activity
MSGRRSVLPGRRALAIVVALTVLGIGAALWSRSAPPLERRVDMVTIPAGVFEMGVDNPGLGMEASPARQVHVSSFRLARRNVTFAEYDAFARATGRPLPDDGGGTRGGQPLVNIDGESVHAYIAWLNAMSSRRFRLPTEAEWEYAAQLTRPAARLSEQNGRAPGPDAAVESPPNEFGLRDMVGMVWQRVQDCWHSGYEDDPTDGSAYLSGSCHSRIAKGGSWYSVREELSPSARVSAPDDFLGTTLGVRLAEDI